MSKSEKCPCCGVDPEQIPRFPDLMASILVAKNEALDPRIARLIEAMEKLPEYFRLYQWQASEKPEFGHKYISTVTGDNGRGTGRQYIAGTPHHIDGLAEFIAAANPDTIAMMIAAIQNPEK